MVRSRRTPALVGLGLAASAWAALHAVERRWRQADDPSEPDCTVLPPGEALEVSTSDGARLAATVAGDGPTVVLAHCWTGCRATWAPVARRLVDRGHRVVLYDQRGHGESTIGTEGITIDRLGADVRDVLRALDVEDAIVAGHSMGGMAAQAFAGDHPEEFAERVRALVLVATTAHGLAVSARQARLDAVLGRPVVNRVLGRRYGVTFVRGSVGRRARHGHLTAIRDSFVATPADVRVTCLSEMRGMDLRRGLGGIGVPVTVVVGTRDALVPPRLGRALAEAIPDARLVELPGAGHMLPLEEPDAVADAVVDAARARQDAAARA